jgi:hypothetical protein
MKSIIVASPGFLAMVGCLLLCGANGLAQENQETGNKSGPPAGPLLNRPPDFSQWIVTFSYADERARSQTASTSSVGPPPPAYLKLRPRTVTTIETNRLVHEIIAVIAGPQQNKWYIGNVQYWKIADEPNWYVNKPGPTGSIEDSYTPLPPSGFRDLDWITEATYADTENYAGRQCLVFKSTTTADKVDKARVAYIDIKTRWPVEVRIAGEVRTYEFVAPPSEMQTLPDDLKQQIGQGEKVRARMDLRAPTAP